MGMRETRLYRGTATPAVLAAQDKRDELDFREGNGPNAKTHLIATQHTRISSRE